MRNSHRNHKQRRGVQHAPASVLQPPASWHLLKSEGEKELYSHIERRERRVLCVYNCMLFGVAALARMKLKGKHNNAGENLPEKVRQSQRKHLKNLTKID